MPRRGHIVTPAQGWYYPEGYEGSLTGVLPERLQEVGPCGRGVTPLSPNDFSPESLIQVMGTFFRDLPQADEEVLRSLLESMIHGATHEYVQFDQINDSKDVNTVPTFVRKLWLQRDLTDGRYLGTPHAHLDFEYIAAGGETSVALPAGQYLAEGFYLLYLDRIGVDPEASGITVGQGAFSSEIQFTTPLAPNTVVRLHSLKRGTQPSFTASGNDTVFNFSPAVDVVSAKVFINNINLEEGVGWVLRSRELVFTGGLIGNEVIRVQVGDQVHTVLGTAGQTRVALPFTVEDPEAAIVTMDRIDLRTGWVLEPTRLIFSNPLRSGYTVRVEGPVVAAHNHQSYSEETTALKHTFELPSGFEFDINDDKTYNTERPIYIWVDRQLLQTSEYTFLSRSKVKLNAPIPANSLFEAKWVTRSDSALHGHPNLRETLSGSKNTFNPPEEIQTDRPEYVEVDGLLMTEGLDYVVTGAGTAIKFTSNLGATSKVVIYGQANSYLWEFDSNTGSPWDYEIVDMETIQNGIDHPSFVAEKDVDWSIPERGILRTNFLIQDGWLKNADVDEETAYNNFGILLDFQEDTTAEYVALVRALMAAYLAGPKYFVKENFARIVLGSPFSAKPGKVKSIELVTT